jgi:hypothetical protein
MTSNRIRINIDKTTRSGKRALKAIVVVAIPENSNPEVFNRIKEAAKTLEIDKHGVLWLLYNEPLALKVYTIKK